MAPKSQPGPHPPAILLGCSCCIGVRGSLPLGSRALITIIILIVQAWGS